jgi:methyltransferase (TIGR00027 family)
VREGIPSITAAAVSLFRGIASLPGSGVDFANDRGMRALMPPSLRSALTATGMLTARDPRLHALLAAPTLGLLQHVALRTAAIDAAIRSETANGIPQLVVLGAGLDARAFRMPELERTIAFEIDFPSTQRLKKARAASLTPTAKELRFVPIDFERESLDDVLARAGHRADVRTLWIWEGVTMYLVPEALEATLAVVRDRSARGSTALVTYATPELTTMLEGPLAALAPVVDLGFGLLGEPIRTRMTTDEARERFARFEFDVTSDTGPRDWAKAHLRGRPSRITIGEHLVRAVRR